MSMSQNNNDNSVESNMLNSLESRVSKLETQVESINLLNARREEKEKMIFDMLSNITNMVNSLVEQVAQLKVDLAVNDTKTDANEKFRIDLNWKTLSVLGMIIIMLIQIIADKF